MILGYNIGIQLGGKTIVGRTQEDLSISAKIKESITKDDQGETQRVVTGHDVTFKISALSTVSATGETTKLDRDEVMALALKKGSEAIIAVKYVCSDGDTYGGNAIITGFSESSSADPTSDTTISLDLQSSGEFAKVTA
ncbi:phage tail tube protein [Paratractidigestivibacter sp.]|uniref:phage tail tube protein n=1 Tax=Paratractidigestivibacter sp. TaxID=2847316 RepID=UPI002AC98B9F|nr:hypothetical protein [Paratractidigestivibacter sp.]